MGWFFDGFSAAISPQFCSKTSVHFPCIMLAGLIPLTKLYPQLCAVHGVSRKGPFFQQGVGLTDAPF
jgi:hypothetical protein